MKKELLVSLAIIMLYLAALTILTYMPVNTNPITTNGFQYSGESEGEMVQITPQSEVVFGITMPTFKRYSLSTGLEEIQATFGKTPSTPKWLPEGMKYADVYISDSVVVLTFSDKKTENFYDANVTIELHFSANPPSNEQLRAEYESTKQHDLPNSFELNGVYVNVIIANDKVSSSAAWFWKNGIYYIVGISPPLRSEDLTEIIKSIINT